MTTSYKCTDQGLSIAFLLGILAVIIVKILYEDDNLNITIWLSVHDPVLFAEVFLPRPMFLVRWAPYLRAPLSSKKKCNFYPKQKSNASSR